MRILGAVAEESELGMVGKKGKEANSQDAPVSDCAGEKERSGVAGPTRPEACGGAGRERGEGSDRQRWAEPRLEPSGAGEPAGWARNRKGESFLLSLFYFLFFFISNPIQI